MIQQLRKAISAFRRKRILVVGDLMMDEYVRGTVDRISPEAPVPVVHIREKSFVPGGAANVANNIVTLGATPILAGLLGHDDAGRKLISRLREKNIDCGGLVIDRGRPTIIKQRIIAQTQQIVRIDTEEIGPPPATVQQKIERAITNCRDRIDAILISDYDKGMITTRLIEFLVKLGAERKIPVTVDPHITHFLMYRDVTVLTPNHKELAAASGRKIHNEAELIETAREVRQRLNAEYLIVTRGEEGMTIVFRNGTFRHMPTVAREVYDVTGAGDTVISILTLGLASGYSLETAARIANVGAGVVVGKRGTATVNPDELLAYARKLTR